MSARSLVGWLLLGASLSIAAPGCDKKKDDSKKEEAKSDKSEKEDGKKKKGGSEKYSNGDALKHVPKSCKLGRFYLNVGGLLKNEAVEKAAEALEDKVSESMSKKKNKSASKALKSLKKSGIDPARDVKEVAFCLEDKKDVVLVVGGDFAGKDPIGAIAKASEEADEKEIEKKETDDGIPYLKDKKLYVAAIAPNVLLFTEKKELLGELKDEDDQSKDWDAKGHLVSFHVKDKKKGDFSGSITENGDDLDVKFVADFKGETGEKIEDDPKSFKKGLEAMLEKFEAKLAKGPFKKIADDIGQAKIKVDGSQVTVTVSIPSSDLGDAIKKAANASDGDLENAVDDL